MLSADDLWLLEPALPDEPTEVFRAHPELRASIDEERDDDLGLRALLEHPEALLARGAKGRRRSRRRLAKSDKQPSFLHAA